MKTIVSRILLVLTVALCVVAAQAQSTVMLKGNVPFNFSIGDRSLPSGEYTVKALDSEIEAWYDPNGRGLFLVKTIPSGQQLDPGTTKLVFHRYGSEYVLTQVCSEGKSHDVISKPGNQRIAKTQKFETVAVLMTSHR